MPASMADGSLTKYGFPCGVRFVPTDLELVSILSDRIHGRSLPPQFRVIFHELSVLSHHPDKLYEAYKQDEEFRYIYFFSRREVQKKGPEDEDETTTARTVRTAKGGFWKASGGAKPVKLPQSRGRLVVGRFATLVFYDTSTGAKVKTNWGIHEFSLLKNQNLRFLSPNTQVHDLSLYRLYIIKNSEKETDKKTGTGQMLKVEDVVSDDLPASSMPVVPYPTDQPFGIVAANQPLAAGASTSWMMPPPPHHPPSVELAQYYHHQYALGAAQQQLHTMSMPVHGSVGLPAHLFQLAGQQAPAATAQGAGQEAGHFGLTRSPYRVPLSMLPPANASPPVDLLPPTTTEMHDAGQEGSYFQVASSPCSPPVAGSGSLPAEQHATATTELMEEAVPPPPEDIVPAAGAQAEPMNDADFFGLTPLEMDASYASSLWCTMDELMAILGQEIDEAAPMQGDNNSGGENYCSQSQAGGTQEPPAAQL